MNPYTLHLLAKEMLFKARIKFYTTLLLAGLLVWVLAKGYDMSVILVVGFLLLACSGYKR